MSFRRGSKTVCGDQIWLAEVSSWFAKASRLPRWTSLPWMTKAIAHQRRRFIPEKQEAGSRKTCVVFRFLLRE